MRIVGLIALSVALSGLGQVLIRAGAMNEVPVTVGNARQAATWVALAGNGCVAVGLLCWALSTMVWVAVLSNAPVSYAYCLGGVNYLLVPVLGHVLLGEGLHPIRIAGMVVVAAGVFITLFGRYMEVCGR
jgi:multidrug transporter EmrE-like cation transporter